ncbi:unnamed protein product, partial [Rotaria magnacalcarata]
YQSDDELSLYRRESPDHLSFIFRHNIIYYIVDDSGRWTLQVQVPDPFSSLFVVMDYSCYFNTYGTEIPSIITYPSISCDPSIWDSYGDKSSSTVIVNNLYH